MLVNCAILTLMMEICVKQYLRAEILGFIVLLEVNHIVYSFPSVCVCLYSYTVPLDCTSS